jgi:hypothetical protein
MISFHRRSILRALLGSGALLPAASLVPNPVWAQTRPYFFGPDFNLSEASDFLYMCDLLNPIGVPTPTGFAMRWGNAPIYKSAELQPFLNKYWVWRSSTEANTFALIVRGTVLDNPPGILPYPSVVEDLLSLLLNAIGSFQFGPFTINWQFAATPPTSPPAIVPGQPASVHAGFAVGSLVILNDFASVMGAPGLANVYIAGHSQGAGVATLLSSLFHYDPMKLGTNKFSLKTYAFAQPKPGNDVYQADFESVFSNNGFGFRVTNSYDFIPQLPFTIEIPTDLNVAITTLPTMPSLQEGAEKQMVSSVASTHMDKLQAGFLAIARANAAKRGVPFSAPLTPPTPLPIIDSYNFVNVGSNLSLIGSPTPPANAGDILYQHHATTYNTLMQAQLA